MQGDVITVEKTVPALPGDILGLLAGAGRRGEIDDRRTPGKPGGPPDQTGHGMGTILERSAEITRAQA